MKSVLISMLLMLLALSSTALFGQEKVRLATHHAFPYHYIENGTVQGDVIRQIKCAFNRMETAYRAEFSDWVDVELRLRTGNLDAIFAVAASPSRNEFGELSTPLASKNLYWYFTGPKIDIAQTNPLYQKYKVAADFGSDEWLALKRSGYNVQKKPRNAQELVKLLVSHEVDAILLDEKEFEYELAKQNLQSTRFSRQFYGKMALGVLFSKAFLNEHPTFLQSFNTASSNCIVHNGRK